MPDLARIPFVAASPAARALLALLLLGAAGEARAATLTLAELSAGDLVITEVMADPAAVDDTKGEYFEIYNASGSDVDLNGLVLTDDGTDSTTVTSSVVVTAGDSAVLAVSSNSAQNGGIPAVDVVFTRSKFRFDNGADEINLSYGGTTFDSFKWGSTTDWGAAVAGVAFNLDVGHVDATSNDRVYYWCDAASSYGSGDLGTPGSANDDCGLTALEVNDLGRGDLILTEVMVNPTKVDDSLGEWFEIYNASGAQVNLYGLVLSDMGTDVYVLAKDFVAEPGDYVLLAIKDISSKNGGLPAVDMTYVRKTFRFDDAADEIVIANDVEDLDEIAWTRSSGVTAGASWSLDPDYLSADENDSDASFCAGYTAYGLGDYGTPGSVNDDCTQDLDADGYTSATDCDDTDATVNPGATESCNGVDDNCDDLVDNDAADATTWSLDYDLDGYGGTLIQELACENPNATWYVDNAEDCDDRDANTFPGGDEVCDGGDNDCDGETDEDALNAGTWYADADADGYGDAASTSAACDMPTGYVANDEDCDDASSAVWPGADETCNDADDDCDGETDEDALDASTWYLDYDDDGYGATKITAVACAAPTYFVDSATDCDDLDPDISPGATDVCDDGIDNNCDDSALECSLTGDVDLSAADAKFTGNTSYTDAGRGLSKAGDVNGDGFDDLLIGAPSTAIDAAGTSTGAAYLVYGPATGTVALSTDADATLTGEAAGDQAGYSVHDLGDQDGDGYDDVMVGARDEATGGTGAGAFYVVQGPLTGSASLSTADAKFTGVAATNVAGFVVSGGGDVNGDGTPDAITGAYGNSDYAFEAGAAYVLFGPASGTASLSTADLILQGEAADDRAGRWASVDGDIDADGFGDVVVGAYANDADGTMTDAGRAYVVYGGVSGTINLADADASFTGETTGDYAGYALETGHDVDGDGYADLLIGAVYENSIATRNGATYLLYGPVSGDTNLSAADAKFTGVANGDHSGTRVALVEDGNGDGRAEILIGAFGQDTGGANAGAAYVIYGAPSGSISLSAADARFIGEAANDKAGNSVANAGDINGDGLGDFLVGAISEATGGTNAGAAYLLLGEGW